MTAIAEYFRDLAAGDRFFGAEPPQPDTEMLHRIAEQTIQSRVNAEVADNGVILRQAEPAAAPAQVAAPQQVPEVAPAAAAPVAEDEVAEVTPAERFGAGNTVAEKLQRIRAVVASEAARAAPYAEDEHAEEVRAEEPTQEQAAFVAEPVVEEIAEAASEEVEEVAEAPAAEPEAPVEETAVEAEADDENDYEDEGENAGDTNNGSDIDLSAVMASAALTYADPETTSDADDEEEALEDAPEVEASAQDVAEETDEPAAVENTVSEPEVDVTAEAETEEAELETADAEDAPVEAATDEDTQDNAQAEEPSDEADEDVAASSDADDQPEAASEAAADAEADEDEVDARAEAEAEVAEEPRPTPRRRIVVQKISRSELTQANPAAAEDTTEDDAELSAEAEAALMAELADLETDTDVADEPVAEAPEAEVEDVAADAGEIEDAVVEAIEDPVAEVEVAEVSDDIEDAVHAVAEEAEAPEEAAEADDTEAEIEADAEADADVDEADEDEAEDARAARLARRSIETEGEEDALERLMSVTSSRLENDESSVRRASIAHLKAAVAATKADSSLAEEAAAEEERELDQYRDDLARVVKPGRAHPRREGSSRARPSPLVLVSEQRVDRPETDAPAIAASADIRPRRISHGNLALQEELEEDIDPQEERAGNIFGDEEVESFGEYAARHSALELPDMLEAAAAHYTWVEDQAQFTRPMLMRKIASISDTHAVSREDGLRAFGTLLRQGAIVKDGNGKFAIAGNSRFAPEAQSDA